MKLCSHCKHGLAIHFGLRDDGRASWGCGYILDTGVRRPCPAENCEMFEERTQKRQPTSIHLKGSRP